MIPVIADPMVPLTRTDPKTGEEEEVSCIRLEHPTLGTIMLVHPNRLRELQEGLDGRRE
jgi:hypothetical protein